MNAMKYKGYVARIEFDAEDEIFVGHLVGIRDRVSFHGTTVAELIDAFHETVDDYLKACAELGQEPNRPYSGRLMLRVNPDVHAAVALAAEISGKSLTKWAEEALIRATTQSP